MSKSKATDYFESEDVDHNNQTSQTPARSASIDQPSTNSANTRPYGELRDIMGPNTNATPTRDHLNGMITATPGGTLHGTVGQEIRVEALLNSARHLQANFRERKITTLDQLIAHLPDMYAQMSCLGRVPALISGRLPQNEATQTEINIAAGLIQSMCSDVEAVTSYLYKWRVLHEDFNIPEMFEALQNGLCGYDRDIGVKALDDVKALRYKGGPISTLLSEMDRLFRIIETRSKKKSQLTDEDKLDILQRKFVGQMLFHPVTCKTHRDYRALCLSLLEYETDLRNAGCLPCKSTTSDTTVEQAYVADSSTRSNRQAFFDGYCRKCNKRGHKERNCPENEELNKQSLSSIQCLICKKFGHPSDECLNKLYATISYLKDNQVKKVRSEKRHYQAKPSDQPAEPYRKKRYANVAETVETLDESSTETASEGETDSNLITDSLYVSHTNSLINHPNAPIDLLDSGANSSHVNNETRFDALHKTPKFFIQTADGKLAESSGRKGKIGHIPNVNYTPQFPHNLVSVSKLVELGYQIKFNMDGAIITDSRTKKLCGTGLQRDGLYFINLQSILPSQLLIEKNEQPSTRGLVLLANNISQDSWTKWHFRLHLPKSSIKKLVESQAVQGLDVKLSDLKKEHLNCLSCAQCQTDKQPKELGYPYGKPEPVIGGQIVTDIWTMGEDGVGGITYCIGFLDVHSGFAHIYFMKKKSEATNMLLKLIAKYRQHGYIIKRVHADNASEYTAEEEVLWRDVCRQKQIEYSYSPPYTPVLNRKIERYWRTFGNLTKTRMVESNCPLSYWPYAARYTNLVQNLTKLKVVDGVTKTPYELFYKRKANLSMLKRWGCVVSTNIDRSLRKKHEPKALIGYFIDVNEENKTYVIYVPSRQKLIWSADCVFDELNMDINNSSLLLKEFTPNDQPNHRSVDSITSQIVSEHKSVNNSIRPNYHHEIQLTDLPLNVISEVSDNNQLDQVYQPLDSVTVESPRQHSQIGGLDHVNGQPTNQSTTSMLPSCQSPTVTDFQGEHRLSTDSMHQPQPMEVDVLAGSSHASNLNRCDIEVQPESGETSTLYWSDPQNPMEKVLGHSGKWNCIRKMKFRIKWYNSPGETVENYRTIKENPVFHQYLRQQHHSEFIVQQPNQYSLLSSVNSGVKSALQDNQNITDDQSRDLSGNHLNFSEANTETILDRSLDNQTTLTDNSNLIFSSDDLSANHFFNQPTFTQSESDIDSNEFHTWVDYSTSAMNTNDNSKLTIPILFNAECVFAARDRTGDLTPLEAFKDPEWQKSMQAELDAIERNETWIPEVMPSGYKALKTKWVFVEKLDDNNQIKRLKSRCTIKGYSQRQGIDFDKTYSPVVRTTTLRTLFAFAAINNLKLSQMDVDTAFLNARFSDDEILYVEPMIGYQQRFKDLCIKHGLNHNNNHVKLRLKKALYGLKQAPLAWNMELDSYLKSIGFEQFPSEPCLYVKYIGNDIIILPVYVDDFIIAYSNTQLYEEFKSQLMSKYQMKDLGNLQQILGMRVRRDDTSIKVDQLQYFEKILTDNHIESYEQRNFPLNADEVTKLATLANEHTEHTVIDQEANKQYRSIVGCLMYAMMCTRPDLAFAVSTLSRYCNIAGPNQLFIAKQVLRYLNATKHICLTYHAKPQFPDLCAFVDAGYGSDKTTRRSPTGFVIYLGGAPIAWKSRLQERVTTSSAEAEYTALSSVVKELLWIRMIVFKLNLPLPCISATTPIFEDNTSAMTIAENKTVNDKTKHIDEKMHFVREVLLRREMKLWFVPSAFQLADMLTKAIETDFINLVHNLYNLESTTNLMFLNQYNSTKDQLKRIEQEYLTNEKNRKRSLVMIKPKKQLPTDSDNDNIEIQQTNYTSVTTDANEISV